MRINKNHLIHRLFAALLSLVVVLSMLPVSSLNVHAATNNHSNAITITVKDSSGAAVSGATVTYMLTNSSNADLNKSGSETTDMYGTVEILSSDEFKVGVWSVSASIEKEGYTNGNLSNYVLANDKQNLVVEITSTTISDINVEGKSLTYTGLAQEAVSVTGIKDTDTVLYELDGKLVDGIPKVINAKSYSVKVIVKRMGFDNFEKIVTTTVAPADIPIDITGNNMAYNEVEQELITLTGTFEKGDSVTWDVNSNNIDSINIPTAKAVGNYTITLTVDRGPNYKLFKKTVTAKIVEGTLNLKDLTVNGLESIYDGKPKEVVKVQNQGEYNLMYQLDDGDGKINDLAWQDDIPTVINAGFYIVWVKAVKENYNDSSVSVIPAEGAITPYNVYVAKANQSLSFKNYLTNSTTDVVFKKNDSSKEFDFEAIDSEKLANGSISYSLSAEYIESEYEVEDINSIAQVDSNGKVTVFSGSNFEGTITVKANLSGNDNYDECSIEHTLNVSLKGVTEEENYSGTYIKFDSSKVNYTLGVSNSDESNIISNATVSRNSGVWGGNISYSIKNITGTNLSTTAQLEYGISFKASNGELKVTNYDNLAKAIREAKGTLNFKISATFLRIGKVKERVTYQVVISFAETPSNPYKLSVVDGANDWYKTVATVTPTDGYMIAQAASGTFGANTSFNNDGTDTRYVYLKNSITGGITDQIPVDIKIDTASPTDLKIEYSELNQIQKIGEALGFYNPSITITFSAKDETSSVSYFEWKYTRADDASTSNLSSSSGKLTEVSYNEKNKTTSATLTLTAKEAEQLRGNIAFTAYDVAGNSTNREGDYTFVVDTVSPTRTVTYTTPIQTVNGINYYDDDVKFIFNIKEANFYSEDVKISVSKDGAQPSSIIASWDDVVDNDIHTGTITLSGDGDYVVYITYKDKSGNEMIEYESPVMTIDTIRPIVNISYVHEKDIQNTVFTVTEHNFRANDVVITGTMKDINGNDVSYTASELTKLLQNAKWTQDGDTYKYVVGSEYVSGIYDLTMNYTDIAAHSAEESTCKFIIDHFAPTNAKIEIVTSPLETLIEAVTFGFYNPNVTVRFTAYDTISGVDTFSWNYTKENGASDINRHTDEEETKIEAVQDSLDKSKFTAEITLPDTNESQLRGYLAVYATDKYNNNSDKFTDSGNIIIVDTIAPEIYVEYNVASRTVGNKAYYNKNVDVTINVKEANFYAEDVVVKVAKNYETATAIVPKWIDKNVDEHVGKFTLAEDGSYVITVEYIDKSGNTAVSYSSHEIIIDTVKPVIDISYSNKNVVNTVVDNENHNRQYFTNTQTAIVKITEHNFNADEVDFSIIAKDVAGNELNADTLSSKSTWSTDSGSDVHTMTITYPGDANYTFDIAYTDLATNVADDYAEDYFTVDKTAPTNLTVSYSKSILDTVLENLSFGFYNAKMIVTVSANDDISGVNSFLYSYVKAAGVSSNNAQLIDEVLSADDITHSNGGRTGIAKFEIPKNVLKNNNQFNGTVEFNAKDRSGNESNKFSDTKRIVVDNIAPNANVSYNKPVNIKESIAYYDGNINMAITINEANFYSHDVQVIVAKNGITYPISPSWTNNSVDVHVGTFTLTEDGDYFVTVKYTDKSSNEMVTYTSTQMTIDTEIVAPTFTINGESKTEVGGAYKNDATIGFNFNDQNFDSYTVKLEKTRFNSVDDVTNEFIAIKNVDKGGSGSFEIPPVVENDGIYVLTVSMTDKAGHSTEAFTKFTINRYGSVYEYDDYLATLIKNGGKHITVTGNNKYAVTDDIVITEYNAVPILKDSLMIMITRDGEPIDVDYTTNPTNIDENTTIGSSGWYQYDYTIKAENFAKDGVYKITLASAYATNDSNNNNSTSVPENSIDREGNKIVDTMSFTVDTTAPEIRNIVNLENAIVNAQNLDVSYTLVDVGGLKSVDVILNDKTIDTITEFENVYNFTGKFTIKECNSAQNVRLVVTDLAGNVTDTASDDFKTNGTYVFNDNVTVSTNFFVRWYANTPLFWSSIIGVVAIVGVIGGFVIYNRKKSENKN